MFFLEHKGFIFDLDGTLIDSNGAWEKINRIIFSDHHIHATDAEYKKAAAMSYEDLCDFMQKKGADITVDELKEDLDAYAVREYRYNIFLKDGVREYLDVIKRLGGKIALATASPRHLYEPVLRNNSVFGYFDVIMTTEEAGATKDFPDIYLKTAEKLELFPEECVVFEDILKGIASAANAGMYTVAVYDRYSDDDIVTMREMADEFIMSFYDMPVISGKKG